MFSAIIDRFVGFEDSFGNVYPINYGYIPEMMGGDGEEQWDVYILFPMTRSSFWKIYRKVEAVIIQSVIL